MGKYQVFKSSSNGQFYFRLKASNGEIILSSEGYISKQGALNGIYSVQSHCPYDHYYIKRISVNDEYYFVLKAGNGEIIGCSEMYTTSLKRDQGIESVKINGTTTVIEDLS
ncbi:YegP family protein [Pasteurella canis]|uniref:YegP family protein n=1 Tax=Pasteurella canis TaxID=753 RepID=UPI000D957183|nr:YegP family protein [Pasteurella canis]SPY33716.1 Uncharacterized conserved protein [Pasteurella canis]